MTANVEAEWDPRINCEGKVDGFTVSFDDRGFDSLSAKWKNVGASLSSIGNGNASASWKFKNASIGAQTPFQNGRSEVHTSELQSLIRISYAVFCLKKKTRQSSQIANISQYHQ